LLTCRLLVKIDGLIKTINPLSLEAIGLTMMVIIVAIYNI